MTSSTVVRVVARDERVDRREHVVDRMAGDRVDPAPTSPAYGGSASTTNAPSGNSHTRSGSECTG